MGSCSLLGQCFEMYSPTAPTAEITKAASDSCASYGTWAAAKCPAVAGGCTCTDAKSTYKTVTFFSMAEMCNDCTKACQTKQ